MDAALPHTSLFPAGAPAGAFRAHGTPCWVIGRPPKPSTPFAACRTLAAPSMFAPTGTSFASILAPTITDDDRPTSAEEHGDMEAELTHHKPTLRLEEAAHAVTPAPARRCKHCNTSRGIFELSVENWDQLTGHHRRKSASMRASKIVRSAPILHPL